MSCSHAEGCPLFPLLRASLRGWRNYYCDSEGQWHSCARYQMALTGERVPISLLPNGAQARHLEDMAGADPSGAAAQSAATRSPEPSGPVPATPETMAQFGSSAPPDPAWHHQPSPPAQSPQPSGHPTPRTHHASSKRGWWAQITDWMKGPA
ncbi:hypothetical protein FPZ41_12385 [Streptomyces sp. K1PN6]|uniref:Uncharacterized protein n=1 Tax=Streptomyces acidicola TaxID=2596892 RepID=A0A5N8WPH3_9ACTN|nr:hypothetical protein [Streptomyces acidicola]